MMGRSLGLAAYLAWERRRPQTPAPPEPPRPDGLLIWAHAAMPAHRAALVQLAGRLALQRPFARMLITTTSQPSPFHRSGVIETAPPEETPAACAAFIAHWRPALCLWAGGNLRPALLAAADDSGVPLFLVDAEARLLDQRRWRWFPGLPTTLLLRFAQIMARSDADALFLRRLGVSPEDIAITGPFLEGAVPLPHDETIRDELAALLRGRPIWLAAMVQPEEVAIVLRAHRQASRIAHRCLLVMVPDDPARSDGMAAELQRGDWRFRRWSEGERPEEITQVLLADTKGDMGLWYRLAPVTFMGSSLTAGQHGRDPNEPAAHGSAIIYGPDVAAYLISYTRYAEAGAARIVRDAETLAAAVGQLIAPDQTAIMAAAAWDVASEGANVTDRILDLVQDTLDLQETQA